MNRSADEKHARTLLLGCTEVLPEGFAVDLSAAPEQWSAASKTLGSGRLSKLCAETLERAYEAKYHEPFLFSAACMAFEFRYHLNAYLWAKGLKRTRHVTTLLFDRGKIERKCRSIEIDRNDAFRWSQRLMFRYFFGVRKGYRRGPRDPYAIERNGRYIRIPFRSPHRRTPGV